MEPDADDNDKLHFCFEFTGIPLIYLLVLYMHKERLCCEYYRAQPGGGDLTESEILRLRDKDPEIAHLHFLYYEYRADFWFFEVVNCLRKMLVVLLVTVVLPGTSFTLAMTMFVVLLTLGMYSYLKPCLNRHEDRMMTLSQVGGC